jgi:hypothetical protein
MCSVHSEVLRNYKADIIYLRYCPAMMFYLEGISKMIYFGMLIRIAQTVTNEPGFSEGFFDSILVECFLCWTIALCFFEYGQLCNSEFKSVPTLAYFVEYVSEVWNIVDGIGLILVISGFCFLAFPDDGHLHTYTQALFPLACIFFSIGKRINTL